MNLCCILFICEKHYCQTGTHVVALVVVGITVLGYAVEVNAVSILTTLRTP